MAVVNTGKLIVVKAQSGRRIKARYARFARPIIRSAKRMARYSSECNEITCGDARLRADTLEAETEFFRWWPGFPGWPPASSAENQVSCCARCSGYTTRCCCPRRKAGQRAQPLLSSPTRLVRGQCRANCRSLHGAKGRSCERCCGSQRRPVSTLCKALWRRINWWC